MPLFVVELANAGVGTMNQRQRARKLTEYRRQQTRIAAERDGELCQYCLRRLGVKVEGSYPHHCFGRAATWSETGDHERYERADKLLTLCYEHHQRCHHVTPLLTDAAIDVLAEVNSEQVI